MTARRHFFVFTVTCDEISLPGALRRPGCCTAAPGTIPEGKRMSTGTGGQPGGPKRSPTDIGFTQRGEAKPSQRLDSALRVHAEELEVPISESEVRPNH